MAASRPASPASFAPPSRPSSRGAHRLSAGPSLDLATKRSTTSTLDGARPSGLVRRQHEPPSPTGLLPSFARGRMLPPPVPTASFDSDPRAYSSTSPQAKYTHLRPLHSGTNGTGASFAKPRAPSPARSGGMLPSMGPPQSSSRLPPPDRTSLRPSPSSSQSENGWNGGVSASQAIPSRPIPGPAHIARPPSPLRHAHSFRTLPKTAQRSAPDPTTFARPASPASHRSAQPSHPSSRFHPPPLNVQASMSSLRRKASQIELDSPTTASQPPSPAAPAHFSMTDRHRTPRSNQNGYRNLVRRASTSEFGAVKIELDEDASMTAAPFRPPSRSSTMPTAPSTSAGSANRGDYSILRRTYPAQVLSPHSVHHFFPPDDPRIAPPADPEIRERDAQAAQPNKRTIFTPYELSVLQGLWAAGAYYPASRAFAAPLRLARSLPESDYPLLSCMQTKSRRCSAARVCRGCRSGTGSPTSGRGRLARRNFGSSRWARDCRSLTEGEGSFSGGPLVSSALTASLSRMNTARTQKVDSPPQNVDTFKLRVDTSHVDTTFALPHCLACNSLCISAAERARDLAFRRRTDSLRQLARMLVPLLLPCLLQDAQYPRRKLLHILPLLLGTLQDPRSVVSRSSSSASSSRSSSSSSSPSSPSPPSTASTAERVPLLLARRNETRCESSPRFGSIGVWGWFGWEAKEDSQRG